MRKASAFGPDGVDERHRARCAAAVAVHARHAGEDRQAERLADLVHGVDADVELLEQDHRADAEDEADEQARA